MSNRRFWIRLAAALLVGVPLLVVGFHYDEAVARWFASDRNRTLGTVASKISQWGDWPPVAGALAATFVGAWLARSRTVARAALIILCSASLAGLSANAIRIVAGRARPESKLPPGWYGPHWFQNKLSSFPSAHTTVIAGGAAAAVELFGVAGLPAAGLVLVMAWARMRTGSHHLTDVAVGAVLGWVVGRWLAARLSPDWPPSGWFPPRPPNPPAVESQAEPVK